LFIPKVGMLETHPPTGIYCHMVHWLSLVSSMMKTKLNY